MMLGFSSHLNLPISVVENCDSTKDATHIVRQLSEIQPALLAQVAKFALEATATINTKN